MKQKYNEIMEHIQLTPEMRERVLRGVQQADLCPRKKSIPFHRILRACMAAAACLAVVAVGGRLLLLQDTMDITKSADTAAATDETALQEGVQIASPMQDYDSEEALSNAVGFAAPNAEVLPFAVESIRYTAYYDELAEVEYTGEGQTATLRKAPGAESVSGDYSDYTAVTELSAGNELTATLKGDGEDAYVLAEWTSDGCAWSLSLSEPQTAEEWLDILAGVQ